MDEKDAQKLQEETLEQAGEERDETPDVEGHIRVSTDAEAQRARQKQSFRK